jgi:tight adherence protein C
MDADMNIVILALVFAAATSLALGLGALLPRGGTLARRLGMPSAQDTILLRRRRNDDSRLLAAGYSSATARTTFRAARVVVGIGFGLAALAVLSTPYFGLVGMQRVIMAVSVAVAGSLLPGFHLDRLAARRQQALRDGFPDSLDLMQVCIEAGLGLDAAIAQVAEEIGAAHPLLAEHYQMLGQELRAGRCRDDALRALAARLGLDEAKQLATLLIQSETLGSSITDALRSYAEDMRKRRMLSAEEKAQQLGVKLSIPLVLFILPALIIVIVSPAAQKMARLFWPLMHRSF